MVRRKGLIAIVAAAAICAACKPGPNQTASTDQVPKIRATVVTIRTTLQPQNKTFTHTLVIANGRARSGDEVDAWRLFDLRNKRVTFVDDLAKTVRNVPLATLIEERRKELAKAPLHPELTATGAKRVMLGVTAAEHLIRAGGYERRLWIAKHPSIPDELFAMTQASASTPAEALLQVAGFPLVDRAELPYGDKKKMVVERSVVSIGQREVPESWLAVPQLKERAANRPRGE